MGTFFAMSAMPFPHNMNNEAFNDANALLLSNHRIDKLSLKELLQSNPNLEDTLTYQYGIEAEDDEQWLLEAKEILKNIFKEIVENRDSPYIHAITFDKPRLFTGEIISTDYGNEYVEMLEIFELLNLFSEPATEEETQILNLTE